jgi:hypothetical protein
MAERKPLTPERLREMLRYEPDTGEWRWLKAPRCRTHIKPGDKAGWRNPAGYLVMCIDHHQCKGHRLAFLYMIGRWPARDVDHRNGNPADDRWHNLREASRSQNAMNKKRPRHNASGFKGVSWHKKSRKWRAYIGPYRHVIHLGYFDTPEAAYEEYCRKARELFGEYARLQ